MVNGTYSETENKKILRNVISLIGVLMLKYIIILYVIFINILKDYHLYKFIYSGNIRFP